MTHLVKLQVVSTFYITAVVMQSNVSC